MSKTTRILLIEKSAQYKESLKVLLSQQNDVKVVGDSRTIKQAIAITADLKPDLVMLGMTIPLARLSDACVNLRSEYRKVKIILMTSKESDDEVFAALASGADGYCLKKLHTTKFHAGIRIVIAGDFWLDPHIARHVIKTVDFKLKRFKAAKAQRKIKVRHDGELSEREVQVLNLVAMGLSNSQIATKLKISAETVKTHIRHIMGKLAVKDRTQAAVKGLRQGLI